MDCTRRDLWFLLPALVASTGHAAQNVRLISKAYRFEDLPIHRNGENAFRPIFEGENPAGVSLELHESDLAPGAMPHPPHRHLQDEIFLIREGTVEVTIAGRSSRLGPGSVAFVASNEEHGIRNVETTHAQYFVLALGREM